MIEVPQQLPLLADDGEPQDPTPRAARGSEPADEDGQAALFSLPNAVVPPTEATSRLPTVADLRAVKQKAIELLQIAAIVTLGPLLVVLVGVMLVWCICHPGSTVKALMPAVAAALLAPLAAAGGTALWRRHTKSGDET